MAGGAEPRRLRGALGMIFYFLRFAFLEVTGGNATQFGGN